MTEVLNDAEISDNKGVNIPDVILPIDALTNKDKSDLIKALDMGVDWVALSFVQQAEDIHKLKKMIGNKALIMAKIEKPSAVKNIDAIVNAADGIMIARGDLGVEMPTEQVPIAQKNIIRRCRHFGKPVIVATQMLESMIDNLVQIGHNVSIGENCVIAAMVGISGSTKIGNNVLIGGKVGFSGHLNIGNNVKIAAQSGVQSDIKNNETVQGSPAFTISEYKRAYVLFRQLPKLNSLVNNIEKKVFKLFDK